MKDLNTNVRFLMDENKKMRNEITNLRQDLELLLTHIHGYKYIQSKRVASLPPSYDETPKPVTYNNYKTTGAWADEEDEYFAMN